MFLLYEFVSGGWQVGNVISYKKKYSFFYHSGICIKAAAFLNSP